MRYFLLYVIVPAAVTLLLQSILCRRTKKGMLRHGALVLPFIPAGNEPSGCVSIHLANAARVKDPVSLLRGL